MTEVMRMGQKLMDQYYNSAKLITYMANTFLIRIQSIEMFNFVKKIVAGPKRMLEFQGNNLDLTHISERIIAMAFPACTILEKMYRNSISDVAQYLHYQYADQYLIINVSNRVYDYSKFQDRVRDFQWPDHQAPPLTTLVHIAFTMFHFLHNNPKGVVAIHCNHGKGRTGTGIIALLLLIGYKKTAEECLQLYNSKRFSSQDYGVDQPCQLRYLEFIGNLVQKGRIDPKIPFYRLRKVCQSGLGPKYHLKITRVRDQQVLLDNVSFNNELDQSQPSNMLFGDVFIQIYRKSKFGDPKKIARINYNMAFLNRETLEMTFSSKKIKLQKSDLQDFEITFSFQFFCLCHLDNYATSKCKCKLLRAQEEMFWAQMIKEFQFCRSLTRQEVKELVHGKLYKSGKGSQTSGGKEEKDDQLKFKQEEYNLKGGSQKNLTQRKQSTPSAKVRTARKEKIYAQLVQFRKSMVGDALKEFGVMHCQEKSSSEEEQCREIESPTKRKRSSTIGHPEGLHDQLQ